MKTTEIARNLEDFALFVFDSIEYLNDLKYEKDVPLEEYQQQIETLHRMMDTYLSNEMYKQTDCMKPHALYFRTIFKDVK